MAQGSNTPQKAELVANGPKLVFRIRAYMGVMSAWGSSCIASISFHSHMDDNKVLKIYGARGPVCLPHAVPVLGPKPCPTGWRLATFAHLNLQMWEPVLPEPLARKFNLERESKVRQHLGITEWHAGWGVRRRPRDCPYKIRSCCPMYT